MKKICFLFLISFLGKNSISAQDQIKRNDGSVIKCKITFIDSSTIYFDYPIGETSFINSDILLNSVSSYTADGKTTIVKAGTIVLIRDAAPSDISLSDPLNIFADSIDNLNKYFIYTFSDEILYGDNISYEIRFFELPFVKYDAKKIDPDNVKFFKNERGFYANTKFINFSGHTDFTTRIIKGRVNLYETEKIRYGSYSRGKYFYGPTVMTKKIKNYYNIGFRELKNVNYRNLSIDLSGNPESMTYLKKFKSISNTQSILYVAGGALIAGGVISLLNKDMEEPNISPDLIAIGLGGVCIFVSATLSIPKLGHIENAIDTFNE